MWDFAGNSLNRELVEVLEDLLASLFLPQVFRLLLATLPTSISSPSMLQRDRKRTCNVILLISIHCRSTPVAPVVLVTRDNLLGTGSCLQNRVSQKTRFTFWARM